MNPKQKTSIPDERFEMGKKQKIFAKSFRETSAYDDGDKPRPNNNLFHGGKSNPLSSKGN